MAGKIQVHSTNPQALVTTGVRRTDDRPQSARHRTADRSVQRGGGQSRGLRTLARLPESGPSRRRRNSWRLFWGFPPVHPPIQCGDFVPTRRDRRTPRRFAPAEACANSRVLQTLRTLERRGATTWRLKLAQTQALCRNLFAAVVVSRARCRMNPAFQPRAEQCRCRRPQDARSDVGLHENGWTGVTAELTLRPCKLRSA